MNKSVQQAALGVLPVVLLVSACGGEPESTFSKHVQPILQQHCVECHLAGGQGHAASGFLVASYEDVMKGTKFGPVVVAGDPLSSSLYRLLAGEVDPSIQMPHGKDPLPDEQVAAVERWIAQGAKNN